MKQTGSWFFMIILALVVMYVGATGRSGELLASFLAPSIVMVLDDNTAPLPKPTPAPSAPAPSVPPGRPTPTPGPAPIPVAP